MQTFAGKAAPGADKLRGGYYTPEPIARFVARWVAAAGPRLLEPACGDGALLAPLVEVAGPAAASTVVGVELVAAEAATASRRTGATVVHADFFTWFGPSRHGTFDGVAGNPPYIRFGHWDETQRAPALDLMRAHGMRPNRLTNAWVPFVVAALLAARPGGRVGLVLPAEVLQVGYAAELRAWLVDRCSRLTVVSFERLVFPGIQQEVVLLLAEPEAGPGTGPARVRTVELADLAALTGPAGTRLDDVPAAAARLHGTEKWTQYYLEPVAVDALRRLVADSRLAQLRHYADIDVGVVTGRNSFFCLTGPDTARLGLDDVTVPLVSRSAQLRGLVFTAADLASRSAPAAADTAGTASPSTAGPSSAGSSTASARTRLLAPPPDTDPRQHRSLAAYLAAGEADGVPGGYKCRTRRTWWRVPSAWVADAFLLRQISSHPKLVANQAEATSTDTVHRARLRDGVDAPRLAVAAFTSVTFAFAEVLGRSYGGGVLELEPSEAEALPVADPATVPPWLVAKADELVRDRRVTEALDLVDRVVLVDALGFDPDEVALFRSVWETLCDRRAKRGRRR